MKPTFLPHAHREQLRRPARPDRAVGTQTHAAPPAPSAHAEGSAHGLHAGHDVETFHDRFWLCLLLTIPTLLWSETAHEWFGFTAPAFPGATYIPAIFGTGIYLYGGSVFLVGGVRELRDRRPGMMTLISLGISVAFLFSLAVTLGYPGKPLWWEVATLVTIMLLGMWIQMPSIVQASGALRELARLLPSTAQRLVGDRIEEVSIAGLTEGNLVLVRPGASIPADGVVRGGTSDVNESIITGESAPIRKTEGARVIAGSLNGAGSLRVEVTRTGDRTALAHIMRLVEQAQTSRSRAQALADRAASGLTVAAILAGAFTLILWTAVGAPRAFAVERLVAVLVIACPHALGLAIPLVIAIATTLGARTGLLVRDRRGLEEARHLTTVVFDKTGTLTRGEFRVVEIATDGSLSPSEALRLAAAIERDSEHTIAQGIARSAQEQGLSIPKAEQFEALRGYGARAVIDGTEFYIGGPAMLRRLAVTPAQPVGEGAERAARRGQASVYLLTSATALAAFAVADAVRPESRDAIRRLHGQEVEVVMLSGDTRAVADAVAADLGIDTVFAEALPEPR
jgi:P-type Cu2+ transporter